MDIFNFQIKHSIYFLLFEKFQFDITKVHSHASRLQLSNLETCNKLEIQRQVNDPVLLDRLVGQARELIKSSFPIEYV